MRPIDGDALRRKVQQITFHGNGGILTVQAINEAPTLDLRSCDGCKYDTIVGNPKCYSCSRLLSDRYEPKEKEE